MDICRPILLILCAVQSCFFLSLAEAQQLQIENADFEMGLVEWEPFVSPLVQITPSEDAFEGLGSCLVSNRQFFWNGIRRNVEDHLEVDQDYRFSFRAKSASGEDAFLSFQIEQVDDRGTRYVELARRKISSENWTFVRGGFHLQVNGNLQSLYLIVSGQLDDVSDFLVDDFKIIRRDWREDADARIEQIRKTDLSLTVLDRNGEPKPGVDVNAEQVRSHFPFGSTLNESVVSNEQYANFFKEHFEWATTEWRVQWFPVEQVQGVEEYGLGDALIEFCEANGINVRGHSIVWPNLTFIPNWLPPLDDNQVMDEVDERIDSVVSRYKGRLTSWDVCNELLDHRFFRDRLGEDINAHVFREARRIDPDVQLFINEFGFLERHDNQRLGELESLVADLRSRGAAVGGIGLQGHFFNDNISPVNLQISLERLAELGLPIWISEYDTVNPDPVERAKQLETFYRYCFSRPEVQGIIMWGFWEGSHWRGADASLVNLDWSINEAGQKYFELMDEWTSNSSGVTDDTGHYQFRGFQGAYWVEATDMETRSTSSHIVYLPPRLVGVQETSLEFPDAEGVLSVYGSDNADTFALDLNDLTRIRIGNAFVPLPVDKDRGKIRFNGLSDADELTIQGLAGGDSGNRYLLRNDRLTITDFPIEIEFNDIESIRLVSGCSEDLVILFDSSGNDEFVSATGSSSMISENCERVADGFSAVTGRAGAGNDTAIVLDSPGNDLGFSDLSSIRMTDEFTVRRAVGFETNRLISSEGDDAVNISCPLGEKLIEIRPGTTTVDFEGASFQIAGFPFTRLLGVPGTPDLINISDSGLEDEFVFLRQNFIRYESLDFRVFAMQFNNANVNGSFSGADQLRIRDAAGDDIFVADGNECMFMGNNTIYVADGFDSVRAIGNQGGQNTAQVGDTNFDLDFSGIWDFIE